MMWLLNPELTSSHAENNHFYWESFFLSVMKLKLIIFILTYTLSTYLHNLLFDSELWEWLPD